MAFILIGAGRLVSMGRAIGSCWRAMLATGVFALASPSQAVSGAVAKIDVVAIASDVQSAVIRDAQGQLRRYTIGDVIVGSDWRLARVVNDHIFLESSLRLAGKPYDIHLASGQSIDLAEAEANLRALSKPRTQPSAVTVHPLKKRSAAGR